MAYADIIELLPEDCPGTCDRCLRGLRLLDLLPVDCVHGGEFRHVRQEYSATAGEGRPALGAHVLCFELSDECGETR